MRSIRIVVGLAAAACLLAVMAAPALATPKWYECKEQSGGKYTEKECATTGSPGTFELVEVKTAVASISEGELELEDSESSIGAVRVKCTVVSEGTAGPEKKDTITSATLSSCKVVKGTCGSPTAVAVHLPWNTELTEPTEGEIRDNIKNSGSGLPGYTVTCTVIIKVKDTCEGETSTKITNNFSSSLVEATFEKKSPKATCSLSKKVSGSVEGTLKTKSKSGVAIYAK
jgi:hypothetical protein